MNLEVIKLGGSVVTHKDQPQTANVAAIKRLAREISSAGARKLIIVHGGGSFGHPLAKEYDISGGYTSDLQLPGFSKTRQAMIQLNSMVVNALLEAWIPAVSVSPSSFIVTKDRRIAAVDWSVVTGYLQAGMVPVLYGDAVLDSVRRFTILSGDQLAARLATDLGAGRLTFGVDVDGVYTANPKLAPKATLIERLSLREMKGMVRIGEALSTDVTGGMLGKVQEAEEAVKAGVEVRLVNALKPDTVYKTLRGDTVTGTTLLR